MEGDFGLENKLLQGGLVNCYFSELAIAELLYDTANSAPDRQAINRQNLAKFRQLFPATWRLGISVALETYAAQKDY